MAAAAPPTCNAAVEECDDLVFAIVDKTTTTTSANQDHCTDAHAFGYYGRHHSLNFVLSQVQQGDCGSPDGYNVVGFKVYRVPRQDPDEMKPKGNGSEPYDQIKPDAVDSQAETNDSQMEEGELPSGAAVPRLCPKRKRGAN